MSLFEMQSTFYEWVIKEGREDTLSIMVQGGVQLDQMRNDVIEGAMMNGQTHLLFLDTDMWFPPKTIVWMMKDLEDNPEIEAITGLYTWKMPPYLPHVYRKYNTKTGKFTVAGAFPLNRLFEVEGAGTGILMVKKEVYERTEKPWFKFVMNDNIEDIDRDKKRVRAGRGFNIGEDLYFCLKARPKMLCDPRIECVHFKLNGFGVKDYILDNGLETKTEDDGTINVVANKEQLEEVAKRQSNK